MFSEPNYPHDIFMKIKPDKKYFVCHPKRPEWGIGWIEKWNSDGTFLVNFSKTLSKKFDPKLMPVAFDQFEATSELLIQFHQEKMEWAGKKYKGFRQREIKKPARVTHCYSCKEQLDNSIDIECVSCGWILCWCGACGCGFDRSGFYT